MGFGLNKVFFWEAFSMWPSGLFACWFCGSWAGVIAEWEEREGGEVFFCVPSPKTVRVRDPSPLPARVVSIFISIHFTSVG